MAPSSAPSAPTRLDGARTQRSEMVGGAGALGDRAGAGGAVAAPARCGATSASLSARRASSSATPSRAAPTPTPSAPRGAYQGFFEQQRPAGLGARRRPRDAVGPAPTTDLLYLPYPVHLTRGDGGGACARWVAAGRRAGERGLPGLLRRRRPRRHGPAQPGPGRRSSAPARPYVEFTPDISDDVRFSVDGVAADVPGALFLQAYEPGEARRGALRRGVFAPRAGCPP